MAAANQTMAGYGRQSPPPVRLGGALAAGTTIGSAATAKERIGVAGMQSARVRVKLSAAPTGTLTVTVYPMLSDAGADDTVGTRGAAFAAGTAITTADEAVIDVTLRGERFIEVEGVMSGGLTDEATLAYVEVTGVPTA